MGERRRWYQVRPAYAVVLVIVLAFTLWTCMPKFAGMLGQTSIKPALPDGTYWGTVVSHRDGGGTVLLDVQGKDDVEFRVNDSTPDDIVMTMSLAKDGMRVKVKVGDGGDLTEWLWVRVLPTP